METDWGLFSPAPDGGVARPFVRRKAEGFDRNRRNRKVRSVRDAETGAGKAADDRIAQRVVS